MISTNAALYLGIFQSVVLERCPVATLAVTRAVEKTAPGYQVECSVRTGSGTSTRSHVSVHAFLDAECDAMNSVHLSEAARFSGEQTGRILAAVL